MGRRRKSCKLNSFAEQTSQQDLEKVAGTRKTMTTTIVVRCRRTASVAPALASKRQMPRVEKK